MQAGRFAGTAVHACSYSCQLGNDCCGVTIIILLRKSKINKINIAFIYSDPEIMMRNDSIRPIVG